MRFAGRLATVVAVAASAAASPPDAAVVHQDGVAAHDGLDQVYSRFAAAYRRLDVEAVAALYAADALYLAPKSPVVRGRDDIAARFASMFGRSREQGVSLDISFTIVAREVAGDLAWDVGTYRLVRRKDGTEVRRSAGKFAVVARRDAAGTWRFQLDSYSGLE